MDVLGRIEQLMEQRDWSVYRLCKESGLAQSTLSHVFRKDSEPTISTLETICKAFGMTLGEFFAEGELVPLTEEQQRLLDKWALLTAEQRMQTCCFTGHRQIPPEERAEITSRLERVITSLYQKGIRYYGAGGALGFDTLAAQTVIRLRESCPGMKLILVLPCLTQARGWRSEG